MTSRLFSRRPLVTVLLYAFFCPFFLAACGDGSSDSYLATIQEGRAAAKKMFEKTHPPSSLSLAFVADDHIVWSETFGLSDKEAGTPPTTETMYGIGSVSKMLATIAMMILVDRGEISLDEPIVTYVPSFRMLSPEYSEVTVRMLLNHSSGFPGSDLRNSFTTSPFPGYAQQVLETLGQERLKHPPGFMNTYCNDGFSMIENLIASVTGTSYAQYVQDEILTPLTMENSLYTLDALPAGSFAFTYTNGVQNPQAYVNLYATGGLYSTPSDMAKLILMILGKGKWGETRVLSESAVEAMAMDQTEGTFNPVASDNERFGLGWDTVSAPGLKAVGVKAWAKGGDTPTYGSEFMVLPDKKMGVMVSGASNFSSGDATIIAERILLRALAEKGVIDGFPAPLSVDPKPVRSPTPQELASITGYFAANNSLLRIDADQDKSITILNYDKGSSWMPYLEHLKMRDDGMFSPDNKPLLEFAAISAVGRTYIILRNAYGYRHYQDDTLFLQKIAPAEALTAAWNNRLTKVWLLVNGSPDSLLPPNTKPRLSFLEPEGLQGLIAVNTNDDSYAIVDPSQSDDMGAMMLFMPQGGRDLNDAFIVTYGDEEWVRFGSYLYRPQEGVLVLSPPGETVVIGDAGWAEWRTLVSDGSVKTVTVDSNGAWKLFDPEMKCGWIREGFGSVTLPTETGNYSLLLYGSPGERIAVAIGE